jgi:hypothetical protein
MGISLDLVGIFGSGRAYWSYWLCAMVLLNYYRSYKSIDGGHELSSAWVEYDSVVFFFSENVSKYPV